MRLWVNSRLDALLPRACAVCGFGAGHSNLCATCEDSLPWLEHACRRCALPLADGRDRVCGACQASPTPFESTHAPLRFEFPVNRLMHGFKFRRNSAMGHALAELLCGHMDRLAAKDCAVMPELWVPVPMHRWRLASRMLNPAFVLARRLAKRSSLPLATHCLRRRRHTTTQTGLGAAERKRNLRGAFHWVGPLPADRHVGLVDDVMTTGSTVAECARLIMHSGAARVSVWVVARAVSS